MNYLLLGWFFLIILSSYLCFCDLSVRRIPNKTCALVLLMALLLSFISNELSWGAWNIVAVLFLFFLYFISFWGGGDTKLAIAFLPAISEQYVVLFVVGIGLSGGVLLAIYLFFGFQQGVDKIKKSGLPFGIPICISGLFFVAASL